MSAVLERIPKGDKWFVFALICGLLVIWLYTRAELIGTLLNLCVGGFLKRDPRPEAAEAVNWGE